jgi:redox-sensitive bicupin YhaK (pirin superfamily)
MTPADRVVNRVHVVLPLGADSQVDRKNAVLPPGYFELFDPFLMMAEDWFSMPGFDWHPHRGIETVTLVLDGELEHGDNRGNAGKLGPGDVQWMTAGAGIVHRELAYRNDHVHTLQLWVNLPSASKLVDARYQDLTCDRLPVIAGSGSRIRLISGRNGAASGPADNAWPVTGQQIELEPGATLAVPLPNDHRAFAYVRSGHVVVGENAVPVRAGEVGWSDALDDAPHSGSTLRFRAPDGDELVRIVLFSGRPIGEPVVAGGPFVMNSRDEIEQAYRDYRAGRFGPVPSLARL